MWNYDLEAAQVLLEPFRHQSAWHAAAFAECAVLRTVLTGRKSDETRTKALFAHSVILNRYFTLF